ncbi:Cof-type HAD-IIB family hydrolase [Anaerotignum sp. MB30-C6]|uniref:Cof-type HAD-IIB family hydrolase n=1 Tax=Anaerotignum sp. MB30-C6 TaxID=3070814 RepID=UPI0027DB080A|nr:Cof-type HAD-IIB family hydrolase [Anaerotignum sp. MB30-C6]WMI81163.1 Cof-type HAD-IIB family hydrolase [Anaerotignum sp. MB30-C6]
MNYKMIFSDMDGTLLKNDTEVSEKNRLAIEKAVKKGVQFVICTGRGVFGVERYLEQLNLIGQEGYVICQNGGAVYDLKDMSLAIRESFSPKTFAPIVQYARELDLELYYYDDRTFIAETESDRVKRYCEVMGSGVKIMEEPLDHNGEFTKCLITGEKEKLLSVQRMVKETAGDELDCFFSSKIFMEVVKKGVSKGNIMEETAQKAGIPLDQVIAVGDSDNDISMITKAGLGIAVANAEPEVKEIADFITENRCEHDAIAEIIEKFIL